MDELHLTNPEYVQELIGLINSNITKEEFQKLIENYHDSDIADALEKLDQQQRIKIYDALSDEQLSDIFAYLEDVEQYVTELGIRRAASVLSEMDSDDAIDILDEIDDSIEDKIVDLMDEESSEDIKLIQSYDEDEIGSKMTTNYIEIKKDMSIKEAMKSLVSQADDNDNISTIYVSDSEDKFYGAIDLKDLIIAREGTPLESIITNSYPTVYATEKISNLLADLQDYSEDSFPVLDENDKILGIITANDITEVVDDELGEDYAKLAGLANEEDLDEKVFDSVKKRIPWLIILLFMSMLVSSIVGVFEEIVDLIPILVSFQSLILDMAGNVGTQSLAVTIRVLSDENLAFKDKLNLVLKEGRVGLCNGTILGLLAIIFVTLYIMLIKQNPFATSLAIACCVAFSLILAMLISSFVGTLVPLVLSSLKIDPAVASGPLITTLNDLVAVVTYYSTSWFILIQLTKLF